MRRFGKLFGCSRTTAHEDQQLLQEIQEKEPWFYAHYAYAGAIVASGLSEHMDIRRSRILDFGCGDGIMALGVRHKGFKEVIGVDLTQAFESLHGEAKRVLSLKRLPKHLHFRRIEAHRNLCFESESFDGIYSWSVFEHLEDVRVVLSELHRVLRSNGVFFLQIEPLFYSPFGSHLRRLVDEPWAHLSMNEREFLTRAQAATDGIEEAEKDGLYRENDFEAFKRYLIGEYGKLNRMTVRELMDYLKKAHFEVVWQQRERMEAYKVPLELARKFDLDDLLTNEIRLRLKKK
jgi:SAM-dependent methyltransferase